jgi:predicted transposase YdaD
MANIREPESHLPDIVRRMEDRLREVAEPEVKNRLWIATYVLMGLRYNQAIADQVLSGVRDMEETVTYQAIVKRGLQQGMQQGTVAEAKRFLFLAAQPRLGSPTSAQQAAINAISDVGRLEAMAPRIHSASNWDELLGAE